MSIDIEELTDILYPDNDEYVNVIAYGSKWRIKRSYYNRLKERDKAYEEKKKLDKDDGHTVKKLLRR